MRTLCLLIWCCLIHAQEVSTVILSDGRWLTGTYDPNAQTVTMADGRALAAPTDQVRKVITSDRPALVSSPAQQALEEPPAAAGKVAKDGLTQDLAVKISAIVDIVDQMNTLRAQGLVKLNAMDTLKNAISAARVSFFESMIREKMTVDESLQGEAKRKAMKAADFYNDFIFNKRVTESGDVMVKSGVDSWTNFIYEYATRYDAVWAIAMSSSAQLALREPGMIERIRKSIQPRR